MSDSAFGIGETLIGDVNLDGQIDLLDVDAFIGAAGGGQYQAEADINQDGVVDLRDVSPFVEILSGGGQISTVTPESIAGFQFVAGEFGDLFQFRIRFDNHEPNSIFADDFRQADAYVRVRNIVTDEIFESPVLIYGIDTVEDGKPVTETIGLVNARMVVDWVFLTPDDFGPDGDYVVRRRVRRDSVADYFLQGRQGPQYRRHCGADRVLADSRAVAAVCENAATLQST